MGKSTLTREMRREQNQLAELATAEMLTIFGSLNFKNIDVSAPGFIEASVSVAERYHNEATYLGADMYLSMRSQAGVAGRFDVVSPGLDSVQLRKDLVYLAPISAKKLMSQGQRIPDTARTVFTLTSGRVTKTVLDGSRQTIEASTVADSQAVAYARQTSAGACDFCVLMAENTYKHAEDALYSSGTRKRAKKPQAAGSKYHDHCRCTVVTLFNNEMPQRWHDKQEFREAWFDATNQGIDPHEFIEKTGKGKAYLDGFN
ncbi:MAG TPA: hypothetical protein VLZ31_00960 [Microbacteriaceae bacterium]|nr:hypothetical protein [Microbacteriaceae bacterium]